MPLIRMATLYGSFLFLTLLYYINVLSHEVNENLSELKNSISLSTHISFEDKFQLVERMIHLMALMLMDILLLESNF